MSKNNLILATSNASLGKSALSTTRSRQAGKSDGLTGGGGFIGHHHHAWPWPPPHALPLHPASPLSLQAASGQSVRPTGCDEFI